MSASLVIEHLDEVEQRHLRFAAALEAIGDLALHGRKEGFHHRVVVAIAAAAHRACGIVDIVRELGNRLAGASWSGILPASTAVFSR